MSHFLALAIMKKASLLQAISAKVAGKRQLSKRDSQANKTGFAEKILDNISAKRRGVF